MAKTDLTAQRLREFLHYDYETGAFLRRTSSNYRNRNAGDEVGRISKLGYRIITIDGEKFTAHRLVFLYVVGHWPNGQVDHINGLRSDNRFSNLRDVPQSTNQQNRKKANANNACGLMGVSKEKNRWIAQIYFNGRRLRLGSFDTPELAHVAYVAAKRKHHAGCTI